MSYSIAVVGTSLGGLQALSTILKHLPKQIGFPIAIVQHRTSEAGTLCEFLQKNSNLPVYDAQDKQMLYPGVAYLAPSGYHMLIEGETLALSTEAPVWSARPSIDVLFESAADIFGEQVIGVILTGASQDGALGLAKIKQRGGLAIVQDPATAESRVMPEAAIAATQVDHIVALDAIAPLLASISTVIVR